MTKGKIAEEKVIQECLSMRVLKGHNQEPADHEGGDNFSSENTDVIPVYKNRKFQGNRLLIHHKNLFGHLI